MNYLTLENFIAILPWVAAVASFIYNVYQYRKAGKTLAEAVTLTINTMKVEDKMTDGAFKSELIQKAEAAAEVLQVSKEVKNKVQTVLKEGREMDIKLGSINGKKIYLGDVAGIGSALAAALGRLRAIKL